MTITPRLVIKLFNRLKSQEILYNLNFPHLDSTNTTGYCIAYCIESFQITDNRLYFRRTDNNGWNLNSHNTKHHMIFDPKENQDPFRDCYWAIRITPEVVKEFLRQRKEYLKLKP